MRRYVVDPDRSTVSAVCRPVLAEQPTVPLEPVAGTVEVDGDGTPTGSIVIRCRDEPRAPSVTVDLAGSHATLTDGREGHDLGGDGDDEGRLVLLGRASRPAGAFGLAGPPMLNSTLQLSFRLVLDPAPGATDPRPT